MKILQEGKKFLLYERGAANLLYYLGKIDRIYTDISKEDLEKIFQNFPRINNSEGNTTTYEHNKWIKYEREKALKKRIDEFLTKNPYFKGRIFIIYGEAHKFYDDFWGYSFERAGLDIWTSTHPDWSKAIKIDR